MKLNALTRAAGEDRLAEHDRRGSMLDPVIRGRPAWASERASVDCLEDLRGLRVIRRIGVEVLIAFDEPIGLKLE